MKREGTMSEYYIFNLGRESLIESQQQTGCESDRKESPVLRKGWTLQAKTTQHEVPTNNTNLIIKLGFF